MIIEYLSGLFRLSFLFLRIFSHHLDEISHSQQLNYVLVRSMTLLYPLHIPSEIRNGLGYFVEQHFGSVISMGTSTFLIKSRAI